MRRLARLAIVFVAVSLLAAPRENPSTVPRSERERIRMSGMHPDLQTLQEWEEDYARAPSAYIDPQIQQTLDEAEVRAAPTSMSLLEQLTYTASERNQGSCGNCWAFAGTGLFEIAHSAGYGVKDGLSVQYVNSCKTDSYACCGGDLTRLRDWYVAQRRVIPWSNQNGSFVDGGESCTTKPSRITCASIPTTPSYPVTSITVQKVTTRDVGQAQAITNIKNVLNQRKAVVFSFCLNTPEDWAAFNDFWFDDDESVLWSIDPFCGHVWNNGDCHDMLIVGYNDDDPDPNKHYWIVLNSWGNAGGLRPNGLLRMKMRMNYDCKSSVGSFSTTFQTADAAFSSSNRLYMAAKSDTSNDITVSYQNSSGWRSAIIYRGASNYAPALAVFNTRLYMAARNPTDGNVRIRYMKSSGSWVSSVTLTGQPAGAAPSLAVFNNRLYLFIKAASGNTIYYRYLSLSGTWSSWTTAPSVTSGHRVAPVAFRDRLYVFYAGVTKNYVYYRFMNRDGTWDTSTVYKIGATTTTTPAAVVRGWDNSLYLVIRGSSDKVQYCRMDSAGQWYSWTTFAGQTTPASPSVAWGPSITDPTKANSRLYISVMASDGKIRYTYKEGSGGWSAWQDGPGKTSGTPVLATYYFSP